MTTAEASIETLNYEIHPAANLFPMIDGPDFDAFVEDIRAFGQQDPVILDRDGRLIDGRNRARACQILGVDVKERRYEGDDVVQFVISHNLHRRHLTDGQRAMIAAKLANRERGFKGQTRVIHDIGDYSATREEAAALLNVKPNQITAAKTIVRDGTPDLVHLVEQGKAPVATAARVATELPPEEQKRFVERVNAGESPTAAAPPPPKPRKEGDGRPPAPPKYGRRRSHVQVVDALVQSLAGQCVAVAEITSLDQSITTEEAARLTGELTKSIRTLQRLNNLLKETTK